MTNNDLEKKPALFVPNTEMQDVPDLRTTPVCTRKQKVSTCLFSAEHLLDCLFTLAFLSTSLFLVVSQRAEADSEDGCGDCDGAGDVLVGHRLSRNIQP